VTSPGGRGLQGGHFSPPFFAVILGPRQGSLFRSTNERSDGHHPDWRQNQGANAASQPRSFAFAAGKPAYFVILSEVKKPRA
jgi:hypothetical protein